MRNSLGMRDWRARFRHDNAGGKTNPSIHHHHYHGTVTDGLLSQIQKDPNMPVPAQTIVICQLQHCDKAAVTHSTSFNWVLFSQPPPSATLLIYSSSTLVCHHSTLLTLASKNMCLSKTQLRRRRYWVTDI